MTDLISLENQLTEREVDYFALLTATTELISSIRALTVSYIDACHDRPGTPGADESHTRCYRYIEKLYEISRTDIPGKLAEALSALFTLRAGAAQDKTGRELNDFSKRIDSLSKKLLRLSEIISHLLDYIIPGYLKRLSAAAEKGQIHEYAVNIPLGFLAALDALRGNI
jgi:hypothetical protein